VSAGDVRPAGAGGNARPAGGDGDARPAGGDARGSGAARPADDGADRRDGALGDGPQASAILAVDVGTGTADVLLTVPGQPLENAVKLVVPSRTQVVAAQIRAATARRQTVLFSGPVMGGGPDGAAMKDHLAAGLAFVTDEQAALTFADDLDKVRARGARVVGDGALDELRRRLPEAAVADVRSGDLDTAALRTALTLLGVKPEFDAAAVAVQDHGFSPGGSNRMFRFAFWRAAVQQARPLTELFYDAAAVPAELTRLRAAAGLARDLAGTGPALVADTGPAALYGALPAGVTDAVLVNAGNGHTICVVARGGRLAGVFEHHTRMLDGPGLHAYLRRFLAGTLPDDEVRDRGGHGAVLAAGDTAGLPLIVTGPRRALLAGSDLPLEFAAPYGDMMLTGCYGLLRALADRGVGGAPAETAP
jgi:uncharacterized protein (DUF1786 family)